MPKKKKLKAKSKASETKKPSRKASKKNKPTKSSKNKTLKLKRLSNPFSTGGGGHHFEASIQALFLSLMLTRGPNLTPPQWPIIKIKLQGKCDGYETDDLIVFTKCPTSEKEAKLLGQIKHSISVTERDKTFGEVVAGAWSDYNSKNFNKKLDTLALLTGPLSSTDLNDTRTILEWARYCNDATEFYRRIGQANFSSKGKQKKLKIFENKLKIANNNVAIDRNRIFDFLRHFYLLGFDLDVRSSTVLALVSANIESYCSAAEMWPQLLSEVQEANKNAGTLTVEGLPELIQDSFKSKLEKAIPTEISIEVTATPKLDWVNTEDSNFAAKVNLIGSWDENNSEDQKVARDIASEIPSSWKSKLEKLILQPNSPVNLRNGKCELKNRRQLWGELGARIFDDDLRIFKNCAIKVLSEKNPKFEIKKDERLTAQIRGKTPKYSSNLRSGLADTTVLIGIYSDKLSNCSLELLQNFSDSIVRQLLTDTDWKLWGSLKDVISVLAEAAPLAFFQSVENAFSQVPCPFDEIFLQEDDGILGESLIAGLLWALESLARKREFLLPVSVILSKLAARDPGGRRANRPINSLINIFLPWLPQTEANFDDQKTAIRSLLSEEPEIGFKFLLQLMPNQTQVSSGTHRPKWEDHKFNTDEKISIEDYWGKIDFISDRLIEMATGDVEKIVEFLSIVTELPTKKALDIVMRVLKPEDAKNLEKDEKFKIWRLLTDYRSKVSNTLQKKFPEIGAKLKKFDLLIGSIAPEDPSLQFAILFDGHEYERFDMEEDWKAQECDLSERRKNAVKVIFDLGQISEIIKFAQQVESPAFVGLALGGTSEITADDQIFPGSINISDQKVSAFLHGYISSRQKTLGWAWVDRTVQSSWNKDQIAFFLSSLPFEKETWKRVAKLLKNNEASYWKQTSVYPYLALSNLTLAIDKLLEFQRPYSAIECLYVGLKDTGRIDHIRAIRALLQAVNTSERATQITSHQILQLIKELQKDNSADEADVSKIEWSYLNLLNGNEEVHPVHLERRLASDPNFFHEVLVTIYRSENDKEGREISAKDRTIAVNAWKLLNSWQIVPGSKQDGTISKSPLNKWLADTRKICTQSGHLKVAQTHIGQVLYYSPPDPSGLWIDKAVAEVLNKTDANELRHGYRLKVFNSRGAYWVDPTGDPEKQLSEKFGTYANDASKAGFHRLSNLMKEIAAEYEKEAARILDEHREQ